MSRYDIKASLLFFKNYHISHLRTSWLKSTPEKSSLAACAEHQLAKSRSSLIKIGNIPRKSIKTVDFFASTGWENDIYLPRSLVLPTKNRSRWGLLAARWPQVAIGWWQHDVHGISQTISGLSQARIQLLQQVSVPLLLAAQQVPLTWVQRLLYFQRKPQWKYTRIFSMVVTRQLRWWKPEETKTESIITITNFSHNRRWFTFFNTVSYLA